MNIPVVQIPSSYTMNDDDFEFSCDHQSVLMETVEVDYTNAVGEHDTYEKQVLVCQNPDCAAVIDLDDNFSDDDFDRINER